MVGLGGGITTNSSNIEQRLVSLEKRMNYFDNFVQQLEGVITEMLQLSREHEKNSEKMRSSIDELTTTIDNTILLNLKKKMTDKCNKGDNCCKNKSKENKNGKNDHRPPMFKT